MTLHVAVSGVRHRTHAVYVASWCRRLAKSADGAVVVTDLDAGAVGGRESGLAADVEMAGCIWSAARDSAPVDHYVAVGLPGIKPWVRLRLARSTARTVTVDEGLSSYGDARSRYTAIRREGGSTVRSGVRVVAGMLATRLIRHKAWRLYRSTEHGWDVNEHIVEDFQQRLSGERGDRDTAVYLAHPWSALGLVSASEYRDHLADVRARVEAAGLRFRVHPHHLVHPRDVDGLELTADRGPAELSREVVGARIVLGEYSSALVNLAAFATTAFAGFGDVAVQRVVSPVATVIDPSLSAAQRSLLSTFLGSPAPATELEL